jgi:hypothetical protein
MLVKGRWWSTFGTYVLASILVGIASAVFAAIVLAVSGIATTDTNLRLVVAAGAAIISGVLTTPFIAAIVAVIYFDLRVRKEGLDLELLAQGVGIERRSSEPEEPPWPPMPGPDSGAAT